MVYNKFYQMGADLRLRTFPALAIALAGSLILLASLSDSPDAHAETYGTAGKWVIDADVGGNCLLTRTSGAESYAFGIVWDDKMKTPYWAFMFNVPDFSFASLLPVYSAELVIAGAGWAEAAKADVEDAGGFPFLFIRLPDEGFEQAFRKGSEFSVTTKFGSYRIPLDHSAAGLDIYIACMSDPTNHDVRLDKSP